MARTLSLLNDSKRRDKIGANAPYWRLRLGPGDSGTDVPLISATVNYSLDGTSGMRFVGGQQLRGWENTPAKLHIGYGSNHYTIFHGRLQRAKDHPSGLSSEGLAYGVTEQLGTRYFQERVSYKGWTLTQAYIDIMDRSGMHPDTWFIDDRGADEVIEEDHDILPETSFLEGIAMLIEPFDFVQYDQPNDGRPQHVVRLRPEFGYWKDLAGRWKESDYPMNGFEFEPGLREFYHKVIVFRRGETTTEESTPEGPDTPLKYEVYAEHEVPPTQNWSFQPKKQRVLYVPDFFGNQNQAERRAERTAKRLRMGAGEFSFECAPVDVQPMDTIGVRLRERVTSHRLAKLASQGVRDVDVGDMVSWLYACVVHEIELELGVGVFRMRLGGTAMHRTHSVVKGSRFRDVIDLSGVPPAAVPEGGFRYWGDTSPTFLNLTADFSELT